MGSFERRGRNVLSAVIGTLAPAKKVSANDLRSKLRSGEICKILFIRPHQGLGDLLLATPAIKALKRTYPQIQIDFLADTYNHFALDDNPRIRRLWLWNKKTMRSPKQLATFMGQLRDEKYDLAFPLASNIPSFTSYLIARGCGAKWVCGFDTQPFYEGANWSRWLAHVELTPPPELTPEVDKFMAFVTPLGAEGDGSPEYGIPESEQEWAKKYWNHYGFAASKKTVAVFLGGNPERPDRLWTVEGWTNLINQLRQDPNITVMAIIPPKNLKSGSGKPEPGIYSSVLPLLKEPLEIFDEKGLTKAAAFLKHVDLFICPDGGLFHIAVAAGVPTLGLLFISDPARWVPKVSHARALQPADHKPSSLSAETVAKAAREMLKLI